MKKTILIAVLVLFAVLCAGCQPAAGWQENDSGLQYIDTDGNYVTGWLELEENTYHFDENGILTTGWLEIDGAEYYFPESGAMATGWQIAGDKLCYFRTAGTRVTGWLSLDGQRYYLTANGVATGPTELDGTVYLFAADGRLTSGWTEVDGKCYYGDANGHPVTGWMEIDEKVYCFHENGVMLTGWAESKDGPRYLLENGAMAVGQVLIEEETHYFAADGSEIYLVNPWHEVPADYTVELVNMGSGHQVAAKAYDDYREMMAACRAAGMNPVVCSSYRTQEYQTQLYQRRIERYMNEGYSEEEATELAGKSVAVPGTSEHQLGLALDIIDNGNWRLDESQARMPTQKWLMEHSWEYGWILRYPDGKSEITGIIYEPWHYRYVGREVAAEIHALGVCLEEYLKTLPAAE